MRWYVLGAKYNLPPFAYVTLAAAATAHGVPIVLVLGTIALVVAMLVAKVADLALFPMVRAAAQGTNSDGVGLGSRR